MCRKLSQQVKFWQSYCTTKTVHIVCTFVKKKLSIKLTSWFSAVVCCEASRSCASSIEKRFVQNSATVISKRRTLVAPDSITGVNHHHHHSRQLQQQQCCWPHHRTLITDKHQHRSHCWYKRCVSQHFSFLYPHNVVKCVISYENVCPSVCLLHSWVTRKRFRIVKYVLHHTVGQLKFSNHQFKSHPERLRYRQHLLVDRVN